MEELKDWIINELPEDGEWFSDGYYEFIDSAEKMKKVGMSNEEIKEICKDLYSAVSTEFGN